MDVGFIIKKINTIKNKINKTFSNLNDNSDSSSSSSSDENESIEEIEKSLAKTIASNITNKNLIKTPIQYFWYTPNFYSIDLFSIPTFVYPIQPFVEIELVPMVAYS